MFIHLAGDEQGKVVAPFMQLDGLSAEHNYTTSIGSQWVAAADLTVHG